MLVLWGIIPYLTNQYRVIGSGYIGVTSIAGVTQYGFVVGEYVGILVTVIQEYEIVIIERKKGSYDTEIICGYRTKDIRELLKGNMKELSKREVREL